MNLDQTSAILVFAALATINSVAAVAEGTNSGVTGPRIVYKGVFIGDSTIPGEQKKDWLQPSHPCCWQLSQQQWIWVFQTRGVSGIGAEHSMSLPDSA